MALSDDLSLLVPKVRTLESDLAAAHARIAELEAKAATPTPTPQPTPTPAPTTPTFSGTVAATRAAVPGQSTPVVASVKVSSGSFSNMIVNVEAHQNGAKVVQVFTENVALTGTKDIALTLPALPAGNYDLVLMVFDGPAAGSYAWGSSRINEKAGTLTVAPAATTPTPTPTAPTTSLYKAPQQVDSYVASNPTLATIADQPQGVWLVDRSASATRANVEKLVAAAAGKPLVLVTYNLPGRDNGNYSAGGASSVAEYKAWIDALVAGLGTAPAYIVVEPDALGLMDGLDATKKAERIDVVKYAATRLGTNPNAKVYVDASHWVAPAEMANRLKQVSAKGFSLNTSNYHSTPSVEEFGRNIVAAGGVGWRYVIDTSRNGLGTANTEWCNPLGQGLGKKPTLNSGIANVDALLWIKAPGESDGTCNGGPAAGQFWVERAKELVANARF